jgi:hypothetical protein
MRLEGVSLKECNGMGTTAKQLNVCVQFQLQLVSGCDC